MNHPACPAGEGTLAIAALPADISSPAWADATKPETAPALVELQLQTLAAAARLFLLPETVKRPG